MRFFLFIILTSIVACNETASERVAKELKNHLQPRDSIINKIKIGETFVLQSSERDGIDRERFREFTYWKDIDNTFFENNDNKGFSNPDEAGGMINSLQIYKALKNNGIFINADNVKGPTPFLDKLYKDEWERNVKSQGISTKAWKAALIRTQIDQLSPLADQLKCLQDIGFKQVDCFYKNFQRAVFGGRK